MSKGLDALKRMAMTLLDKRHLYAVMYKGQYIIDYNWKKPRNKRKWVFSNRQLPCPLPYTLLEELVMDTDFIFEDLGVYREV